jgi:sugar porter (SP) family MFS transporter
MNSIVIRGVLVGALAGLLFGFDTAVISGVTDQLRTVYQLSPGRLGITVSSALWGTLAGALMAGVPGDRLGARQCLKAIALLYMVSAVGCALAWDWPSLLVFRAMTGLAIGASTVLAPVYVTEIAPPTWRGAMVGMFQFNITLGILVAYLSNYLIGTLRLGLDEWRWKFAIAFLPGLILFGLLFAIPQSPRWLAQRGRRTEARTILRRIAPQIGQDEEDAILSEAPTHKGQGLSWAKYRKPILLVIAIAAFNQLAGINAILYYLNDIFAAAGFSKVSAAQQAIVIGATNLLCTIPALYLIDRIGRKSLLLIGSIGLFVTLSGTAAILATGLHQNLLLWMLIGFVASFAFSQGAVIWVYISEIFPSEVRARGQSIGTSTHWLLNAIIAAEYPVVVATYSKAAPFFFFAAMVVLQFVVVLIFFPETKRAALEDISAIVSKSA